MKGVTVFVFLLGAFIACSVWPLLVLGYHIYRGQ